MSIILQSVLLNTVILITLKISWIQLDVVILGASEIDLNFNVNVTTGFDHRILGGSGGHADTAYGSKFAIIVSKLVSSRISVVVDRVTTITTPGETVDALVTDYGIAIHPRHSELIEQLKKNHAVTGGFNERTVGYGQ
jgi:citrate lyase subunit alpha / citrate CoA-transferase